MFKKLFKLFVLSLLFSFTLSCTFVVKNTGEISLNLAKSSSLYSSKEMTRRENTNLQYNVSIKPSKTNIRQYNFDAVLDEGSIVLYDIPVGNYSITITTEDNLYTYKGFQEFEIIGGCRTSLEIKMEATLKPKPTPEPKPEPNPNSETKVNLTVSFDNIFEEIENPTFEIKLLDDKDFVIDSKNNVSKDGCTFTNLKSGKYKLNVKGQSSNKKYEYLSFEAFDISQDINKTIKLTVKEAHNKGTVTLVSGLSISDNPNFTIDIKTKGISLDGYPKEKQNLPFTLKDFEAGNYQVSIIGKGSKNNYATNPQWIDVVINPNDNKEQIVNLTATERVGSISGNFTGVTIQSVENLKVTANGNGLKKEGTVLNNSSYEVKNLPIGEYSLTVSGSNTKVFYIGELLNVIVKEGENPNKDINIKEYSQFGSISGNVTLPSNTEGLSLNAKALSYSSNSQIGDAVKVDSITGKFTIINLPEGSYKVVVEGSSNTATYSGKYDIPITVEGNQESKLNGAISLTENLKNGSITLKSSIPITDNAKFTIDIRKGADSSSLKDYPKQEQSLPYNLNDFEPGDYKVSITGIGSVNKYATQNTWQTITVQPGVSNKVVEIVMVETKLPEQNIPTSLYVSVSGDDTTGDGKTAKTAFATVSKAISLISDTSKQYTLNIIAPHETPISENIEVINPINIKLLGDGTGAQINGVITISNKQANVSLENITVNSSDNKGTIINTGALKLELNSFIENTSTEKIAIELKDTGVLHYNGSSMFEDQNILFIDNINANPYLMINFTSSDLLLPTIRIANIDNYLNSPLIKTGKGIDIKTIIPNIALENSGYELTDTGNLKKKEIITPTVTPDPSKGIFVVDASGVDDGQKHGGKEAFKTVSYARNYVANNLMKKDITIYVTSDIEEPTSINGGSGYAIAENVTITSYNNKKVTIHGNLPFALQGSSAILTLGKDVTIENTSNDKEAIRVGTSSTVNLTSDKNIANTNYINVQSDGKINIQDGYTGADGAINIKMKGQQGTDEVGGASGKQLITTSSSSLSIADAVKKVTLESERYIINSNGKIGLKQNGGGGSGGDTSIINLWDATGLQNKIANGGTFGLAGSTFNFENTIKITSNVTFVVASDVILKRSNMTNPIFDVAENATLTIKRKDGSISGTAIFDGIADKTSESFIVSSGNVNLENCILQNNKDTALVLNGGAIATLVDTKVTGNTAVNNGGGISLNPDKKSNIPELYLRGNTLISNNKVSSNKYGGGVYVNLGWVKLEGNAKITSDNSADNTRGKALYFQSKTGGAQLNGAQPINQIYDTEVTSSTK